MALALQLGNLYGLMGLVSLLVLPQLPTRRAAKTHIACLLAADVGHVGATAVAVGRDRFLDVTNWNAVAYGNIGITAALFVLRLAFLFDLLGGGGRPAPPTSTSKSNSKSKKAR